MSETFRTPAPAGAAPQPGPRPEAPLFDRIAFIGIGLIGSSLARAVAHHNLARSTVCTAKDPEHLEVAHGLKLTTDTAPTIAEAVRDADLVVVCVPVGAYAEVAEQLKGNLKPGVILSDVGSTKTSTVRDLAPALPEGGHLVPGHPIAGTEHSGPAAGFAELFMDRWCILTPPAGTDPAAVEKVAALWRAIGSWIEVMEPEHHDKVLGITSHLPHLIAYTIVGTATDLEEDLKQEVIKFSASGFRDFTRIAASDPVMWRDVFLNNREAVLEIMQRFTEDLTALQRAIRRGEADTLETLFTRTRAIRRAIIDAKQA
ncbi:prephenate/arogenate dehydrogenase family protein [Caenispirillum salinarum]|uniref:prephenate/arogenate dehydrogenase family protein n=1 Tax=Caenispirillum salinarum TaxID=859058 RepID=UPI0038509128